VGPGRGDGEATTALAVGAGGSTGGSEPGVGGSLALFGSACGGGTAGLGLVVADPIGSTIGGGPGGRAFAPSSAIDGAGTGAAALGQDSTSTVAEAITPPSSNARRELRFEAHARNVARGGA
jgi:hypothetical protein